MIFSRIIIIIIAVYSISFGKSPAADTLRELTSEQKEEYQDEADSLRDLTDDRMAASLDSTPKFAGTISYLNHSSYRGRDGGSTQNYFMLSAEYYFPFGLSITGSMTITDSTTIDGEGLGISYQTHLGKLIDWSIGYEHMWFSSNSKELQAVFNDALNTSFTLSVGDFSSVPGYVIYIGSTASESTISWTNSYSIEFTRYGAEMRISAEPGLTANWGSENQTLVNQRAKNKGKKAVIVTKMSTNNYFGILDYEFSLPLRLNTKNLTISAVPKYVIPYNVIDGSSTSSFLGFEIGVTLKLR